MHYTVAVLGASPKEERYSNRAVFELTQHGHTVFPIHPTATQIHGQKCYQNLSSLPSEIHTLTLYVGADKSTQLQNEILQLQPKRIIMNPGAENDELEAAAQAQQIEVVRGCTLVMLRLSQF